MTLHRAQRNVLLTILVALLGSAVAVAAHGRSWSNHAAAGGWSARTLALIVIAGVAPVALLLGLSIRRHQAGGLIWQVGGTALGAVTLLAAVVVGAALLFQHFTPAPCTGGCGSVHGQTFGGSATAGHSAGSRGSAVPGKLIPHKSTRAHSNPTSLLLVWLALALLCVGSAFWLARQYRVRRKQPLTPPATSERSNEGAAQAAVAGSYIEASLDDLRRDVDLRRAIIACYARMEQLLAHIGCPRERWETPLEFLDRTYPAAGKPLDRLTRLYEEAQFSPHRLDEERRVEAITALTTLRSHYQPSRD